MRFSFAEVMGARTRYLHAGEGKPVLLVHGVGMSADSWMRTVPALAKIFFVCAPDLLDNGFTESGPYQGGPPQPYILDHLIALADHLKLEKFSVIGSSLGSTLAALLYLRHPERIDKIVIVGPGAVMSTPEEMGAVLRASHANGRSAIENPTYESCRARMARVVFDVATVPDALLMMQMTLYALPGALENFERRMRGLIDEAGLREFEVYSRLEKIAAPTLVLFGRQDPRGDFAQVMATAKRLPNAKVIVYERCGHWPHLELPEKFNADVLEFLTA